MNVGQGAMHPFSEMDFPEFEMAEEALRGKSAWGSGQWSEVAVPSGHAWSVCGQQSKYDH
jgi:hypothetical protein